MESAQSLEPSEVGPGKAFGLTKMGKSLLTWEGDGHANHQGSLKKGRGGGTGGGFRADENWQVLLHLGQEARR